MDQMIAAPDVNPYVSIAAVVGIVVAIASFMLVLAHVVVPARKGPIKDSPYESGVPVVGDARGRFNVRFYVVALLFLLFDVEVVFLWPWARAFFRRVQGDGLIATGDAAFDAVPSAELLLGAMGIFVAFLVVGYLYEWRKGVFQWD